MNIKEVSESRDIAQFIERSCEFLQNPSRVEFGDYLKLFSRQHVYSIVSGSSVDLSAIALRVRELSFSILVDGGDLPEFDDLFVAVLFQKCSLESYTKIDEYLPYIRVGLESGEIDDLEKVYFAIFEFYLNILNCNVRDGFSTFVRRVCVLNIHNVSSSGIIDKIPEFFDAILFTYTEFLETIAPLFEKEFYFLLKPYQRRSIFNWCLHVFWSIKEVFNHPEWNRFYPVWKEIVYEHAKRGECDQAMYVHFFIYHVMGNSFQTADEWKMYNDEISRPLSQYYKKWQQDANLPTPMGGGAGDGKKLIGFLWDRVVMNSPFKVAYSLWKALCQDEEFRSKYRIKIYSMSYFEKSTNDDTCIKMLTDLGIEVIDGSTNFYQAGYYHSHLDKALFLRKKIVEDGVDVLIHGAAYDITDFIVAGRAAPRQIYWSHGNNEYDVSGIDARITHCAVSDCEFEFEPFAVPMDIERFYNPPVDMEFVARERAKYPQDAFILGTIGRLVKIDNNEYLDTVAKILSQNPNTIYLACGEGNRGPILEKLTKLGIVDRFYFPGHVDSHIYGHILDLYLDTFPLGSGESLYEFMSKSGSKTFVTLKDDEYLNICRSIEEDMIKLEREFCKDDIFSQYKSYKDQANSELFYMVHIASSIDEYIKKASVLIHDNMLAIGVNYYFLKNLNHQRGDGMAKFIQIL